MNALILRYSPYIWNEGLNSFEGADGEDWDLIEEIQNKLNQVINYNNYANCDFNIYWNNFKDRFFEIKNSTLDETDLYNFEKCAKEIYDSQYSSHKDKRDKNLGNYYFYILERDIIEAWNTKYGKNLNSNNIDALCEIGDSSRKGYISLGEIDIYSTEPVAATDVKNFLLRYHEIEWINDDVIPRITKICITAPMGTMFFLNGVFRPIYISNWANEYSPDVLKGIFNLDTNNIMPLTRITFPKEAAPVFKWENCEDIGVTKTDMEKTEIIVTVYYDDINE